MQKFEENTNFFFKMNIKNLLILVLQISSMAIFFACSSGEKKTEQKVDYSPIIKKYYEASKNQNYSQMADLCHKFWFKFWDYEETVNYFTHIDDLEGKVITWEITEIDDNGDFTGEGLEGKQVQVLTFVEREYANTEEMFILYKEDGAKDFEILTHSLREIKIDTNEY